jgi:hypothetical protein
LASIQLSFNCLDDALLITLVEIGVHGKADDFPRNALCHGKPVPGDQTILVSGLLMEGLGIKNCCGYATRLERRGESAPPA